MSMLQRQFIVEPIDFILKRNYFVFNNKFYLQHKGTAMGAKCVPAFANFYMGSYEKSYIHENECYC